MARGRMISRSLSTSEKWAALHGEAGKLAEFCQSLFPLLVAYADDYGRQQGDVFTVKHAVHPTSPRKLEDFKQALIALHNVGLVIWYQVDGKWVLQIRSFEAHQDLHKKAQKSKFPEFTGIPGRFPEDSPLREEKRTELKGTEPMVSDAVAPTPGGDDLAAQRNREIHAFLKRFCELWEKYRHAKYHVTGSKDVPIVRRLLGTYARDELECMAVILVTTDDEWIAQTDRSIGILSTKANKLADLLAAHRARRRGVA